MLKKIKNGSKLYIVSPKLDVEKRLRPSAAEGKYIEILREDLVEEIRDVKGKSVTSWKLPPLMYDGSSETQKLQTVFVQFHPKLFQSGAFITHIVRGENLSTKEDLPELPSAIPSGMSYVARVYWVEVSK